MMHIEFKEGLSDFLDKIKDIKSEDYNEKVKNSVYLDYKELYAVYSTLSSAEINQVLTKNEMRLIECLKLGLENENEFNSLLLKISTNTQESVEGVVNFIKSRQGFELIHKGADFNSFSDDELVEIFGGLFGVQIAKDCVKSLRAEKVGRIIGYVLSENLQEDKLEFDKLKAKGNHLDFCNFVREKIQEHDVECSYIFNEEGDDLEIACSINKNKNAKITEVRGRNRIDHCFVNDTSKVITFGQSTSNKDTDLQKYTFYKAYIVLKELVSKELINGEPNPYFGYELRPYLMLGGRFVADNLDLTQEKGRDLKKMLNKASSEDFTKLAQMQYFSLYGNAVNMAHVNSLSLYNVFIAGCDTLNLYELSEKISFSSSEKGKNKIAFKEVTAYVTDVCSILEKNQLSFSSGGKGDLALFLNDIVNISKQMFVNFNFELTQKEFDEHITPLHSSIGRLIQKVKPIAGQFGNEILNSLRKINKDFSSLENYNEEISSAIVTNTRAITWIPEEKIELQLNIKDLTFVKQIAHRILPQLGLQGRKFFSKYAEAIHNKITYDWNLQDTINSVENFANDSVSFRSSQTQFLKSYGYLPFAKFVEKSKFILDDRLTPEKFTQRAHELVDFIEKELIPTYPDIGESLMHTIRKKLSSNI